MGRGGVVVASLDRIFKFLNPHGAQYPAAAAQYWVFLDCTGSMFNKTLLKREISAAWVQTLLSCEQD